jgi:hypothetical protein
MSEIEDIIRRIVREELQEQMPGIIARALDDRRAHAQGPVSAPVDAAERLTVREAAVVARRSPDTLRLALDADELHGAQQRARGKWTIERQCLLAWIDGAPCVHQQNVAPLRPRRPR